MGKSGPNDEDFSNWPPWLKPLLHGKFFVQCGNHTDYHKNECNMYCLNCMNDSICSLCLHLHTDHHLIQIRRSSYSDVVRATDIQELMDISDIQTYTINGHRIVFLNGRPQSRHGKGVTNTCRVCERSLPDNKYLYCSLGCKVVGTSKNFQQRKKRKSCGSESEDSFSTSSTTTREETMNNDNNNNNDDNNNVVRSSTLNFRGPKSRRKGIPHRAPLT